MYPVCYGPNPTESRLSRIAHRAPIMLVNTKYESLLEGPSVSGGPSHSTHQGRLQGSHQITLPSVDYY
jgi:hypothetical protein